jgi:hypothetical protein
MTTAAKEPTYNFHFDGSYIEPVLDHEKRKEVVPLILNIIEKIQLTQEIGAIACMGASGLGLAPIISWLTGLPLLIVDKDDEASHSETMVRGGANSSSYIILDDFIESGRNLCHIKYCIEDELNCDNDRGLETNCIGVILYASRQSVHYITDEERYNYLADIPIWGIKYDNYTKVSGRYGPYYNVVSDILIEYDPDHEW